MATDGLDIRAGVGWLDTEITEAPVDFRGIPFVGTVQKGDALSFSPELGYNLLIRHSWELADDLTVAAQADYSYKDDITSILGDANSRTEDLESLGARISVGSADGRWELAAWGRNLADEDAVTYGYTNFLCDRSYSLQMPRSYGVNFMYRWE